MHFATQLKYWCAFVILCTATGQSIARSIVQEEPPESAAEETTPAPPTAAVVVDGNTLFLVRGLSAYPAERRAQDIADRIKTVAANHGYSPQSLRVEDAPFGTRIFADKQIIMTVSDSDARIEGVHRQVVAQAYLSRIREAIIEYRHDRSAGALARRSLFVSVATLGLVIFLWVGHAVFKKSRSALERRYRKRIHGVHIQSFHILRAEHLWRLLTGALSIIWAVIVLIAVYADLHYASVLFPWTRGFGNSLFTLLVAPVARIGASLLNAIPELVFLGVLIVVTWYALKLIRLFFSGIEAGAITFSGFDATWARPTYRLVRVAVVAFALVVAYPYIPGSASQAFKGITLFIGVVFSLGSTSLIGNIVSGYSMAYRRLFKQGDRVKIGDFMGDVEEIKLMSTYLRTPKNEMVAVPNSTIVNSEVVNYSTLAQKEGLILHTTVGIGYETPWRQVEAMLLQAAERTPGLLHEPRPFVRRTSLGDFAITYEINAYTNEPRSMNELYTGLHSNILDVFNEFGVQIMTPAYEEDPMQAKIVPKDQWYAEPASKPQSDSAGPPEKHAAA